MCGLTVESVVQVSQTPCFIIQFTDDAGRNTNKSQHGNYYYNNEGIVPLRLVLPLVL